LWKEKSPLVLDQKKPRDVCGSKPQNQNDFQWKATNTKHSKQIDFYLMCFSSENDINHKEEEEEEEFHQILIAKQARSRFPGMKNSIDS
jgi:hypothetical protein